jgi:hypothetical protein
VSVEEAIADKLAANAGVIALVGARVWQLKWPQNPILPAVMVQVVDELGDSHLRGKLKQSRSRVQVDAYGKEAGVADPYGDVIDLASAVNAALVGVAPFTIGDRHVMSVELMTRRVFHETGAIRAVRVIQEFDVFSETV